MSLLCISCARADPFIAKCHHLQEPSLPLSWLKFIVYVLLSFSNWLKFTHSPRSYFKPFRTHILICPPPNKTKFIHDPQKSQSVIVARFKVTKSSFLLFLHLFQLLPSLLCWPLDLCTPLPVFAWPHAKSPSGLGVGTTFPRSLWSGPPWWQVVILTVTGPTHLHEDLLQRLSG